VVGFEPMNAAATLWTVDAAFLATAAATASALATEGNIASCILEVSRDLVPDANEVELAVANTSDGSSHAAGGLTPLIRAQHSSCESSSLVSSHL